MEHPPKQGLKPRPFLCTRRHYVHVLMEHPPKQGLKQSSRERISGTLAQVLMEHPPKQGLKPFHKITSKKIFPSFNGTSTKTRIETARSRIWRCIITRVLMEHPPKQGLKHFLRWIHIPPQARF